MYGMKVGRLAVFGFFFKGKRKLGKDFVGVGG